MPDRRLWRQVASSLQRPASSPTAASSCTQHPCLASAGRPLLVLAQRAPEATNPCRWHHHVMSGSWASPSIMGFLVGLGRAGDGFEGIVAWISSTTLWPAGSQHVSWVAGWYPLQGCRDCCTCPAGPAACPAGCSLLQALHLAAAPVLKVVQDICAFSCDALLTCRTDSLIGALRMLAAPTPCADCKGRDRRALH